MNDIQRRVNRLENHHHRKQPLKDMIDQELGELYQEKIPDNLKVEFLRACDDRIAPEEDPYDRLERSFDGYSEEWLEKKTEQAHLATALKLLLYERVHRSEDNVVDRMKIELLAQLVVAMQTASETYADQWRTLEGRQEQRDAAPERGPPAESPFEDGLPFKDTLTAQLDQWLADRRSESDGSYAVYVLDCTPKLDEDEDPRITSLRGRIVDHDSVTKPVEKAGKAANNNERVFYVGKANDVRE